MKKDKTIIKIISLGIIAGMRATFAPAIAAHFLSKKPSAMLSVSKLGFVQSPTTAIVTKLLCAGEIAGDKLPDVPDKIIASSATVRVVSGAFAGAVIATANDTAVAEGILIGGATALASTFATFHFRKFIDKTTFVKEPVNGVLEDVLAIGLGILIIK